MTNILLLDDENHVVETMERILKKKGWSITSYSDPIMALAEVKKREECNQEFDLILTDYRMPVMDGISFLEKAKIISPATIRVILSGEADLDVVMDSINRAETFRFLQKPCNAKELISTLQIGLEHRNLLKENKLLADLMRAQQKILNRQSSELERLEKQTPGITKVDLDEDGAVVLNVKEYLLDKDKDKYW